MDGLAHALARGALAQDLLTGVVEVAIAVEVDVGRVVELRDVLRVAQTGRHHQVDLIAGLYAGLAGLREELVGILAAGVVDGAEAHARDPLPPRLPPADVGAAAGVGRAVAGALAVTAASAVARRDGHGEGAGLDVAAVVARGHCYGGSADGEVGRAVVAEIHGVREAESPLGARRGGLRNGDEDIRAVVGDLGRGYVRRTGQRNGRRLHGRGLDGEGRDALGGVAAGVGGAEARAVGAGAALRPVRDAGDATDLEPTLRTGGGAGGSSVAHSRGALPGGDLEGAVGGAGHRHGTRGEAGVGPAGEADVEVDDGAATKVARAGGLARDAVAEPPAPAEAVGLVEVGARTHLEGLPGAGEVELRAGEVANAIEVARGRGVVIVVVATAGVSLPAVRVLGRARGRRARPAGELNDGVEGEVGVVDVDHARGEARGAVVELDELPVAGPVEGGGPGDELAEEGVGDAAVALDVVSEVAVGADGLVIAAATVTASTTAAAARQHREEVLHLAAVEGLAGAGVAADLHRDADPRAALADVGGDGDARLDVGVDARAPQRELAVVREVAVAVVVHVHAPEQVGAVARPAQARRELHAYLLSGFQGSGAVELVEVVLLLAGRTREVADRDVGDPLGPGGVAARGAVAIGGAGAGGKVLGGGRRRVAAAGRREGQRGGE